MSKEKYILSGSCTHPEDLADGRTVSPGQEIDADGVDAEGGDKRLIDEGKLLLMKPVKSTAESKPDAEPDDGEEEKNDG